MTAPALPNSTPGPPAPDAPPADEDKTFTQAEVNAILAREKRAAKPADYDELRKKASEFDKLAEANQSDQERAAKAAADLERRAAEAEGRALRLDVAFDKGLTPAQAKRLVGATREDLEADADEILRDFPVKPAVERKLPDLGQGDRDGAKPRARDAGLAEAQKRFGTPAGTS